MTQETKEPAGPDPDARPLPTLAQSADTAKPATTGTGTETPTTNAITRKTMDTTKTCTSTTRTKTDITSDTTPS